MLVCVSVHTERERSGLAQVNASGQVLQVCVCVCERERVCMCVRERERESVYVCVRERERESECVCERERERREEGSNKAMVTLRFSVPLCFIPHSVSLSLPPSLSHSCLYIILSLSLLSLYYSLSLVFILLCLSLSLSSLHNSLSVSVPCLSVCSDAQVSRSGGRGLGGE